MQTIQLIDSLSSNSDSRQTFNDDKIISLAKHLKIDTIESGTFIRSEENTNAPL